MRAAVSHDTKSEAEQNPEPRAGGASPAAEPVGWTEMLAAVKGESNRYDFRLGILKAELSDRAMHPKERANVLRVIEQQERHAEVFAAAWRVLWSVRSDQKMLDRLKQLGGHATACRDNADDEIRYE
jgi:hypothetical protein